MHSSQQLCQLALDIHGWYYNVAIATAYYSVATGVYMPPALKRARLVTQHIHLPVAFDCQAAVGWKLGAQEHLLLICIYIYALLHPRVQTGLTLRKLNCRARCAIWLISSLVAADIWH